MSSGKIHSAVTIGSAAGFLAGNALGYFTKDIYSIATTFIFVLIGVFVGPDQDVDNGNISDYYLRKIHMDWLWGIFWKPYRIGFQHRSTLSHFPVISTLIRIIYILFPVSVILIQNQQTHPFKIIPAAIISQILSIPLLFCIWWYWNYVEIYWPFGVLGLVIPDTLHWVFDR